MTYNRHVMLLAALCLWLSVGAASADVYALVIGVDRYDELPTLDGAVADAADLRESLESAGAEVTTLLDEQVTRAAVLDTWRRIVATSGEEDVLVLTYAGHGIQVPDRDGDEDDGFDEAFVMPGFRMGTRDDANLIRDDSIARLAREAAPRLVVTVADTCHSGTVTRAADPRADFRAARYVPRSAYAGSAVKREVGAGDAAKALPASPDNSALFAAVPDHLEVQEVLIDGVARGALSWSFARGVEGAADSDGDAMITLRELSTYVPESVRALSDSRQTPVVTTRAGVDAQLFTAPAEPLPSTSAAVTEGADASASVIAPAVDPLGPLRLAVAGDQSSEGLRVASKVAGIEIVPDPERADLIWQLPSGDVITALGDVAARLGPARSPRILQGVVTKWRLLQGLRHSIDGTLQARLWPGDAVHRDGDRIAVEIASTEPGRLLLFDLAADGSLIVVAPRRGLDPGTISAAQPVEIPLRIGPPFGADHLIAVRGEDGAVTAKVMDRLRDAHGRPLENEEVEDLIADLRDLPALPIAVYTAP